MAQLTVPVVFDHDDLQRLVSEKITEVKAQFIPKDQYESRLKADMVAMLTDIQSEIDKIDIRHSISREDIYWNMGARAMREKIKELTQEKINSLKESENE